MDLLIELGYKQGEYFRSTSYIKRLDGWYFLFKSRNCRRFSYSRVYYNRHLQTQKATCGFESVLSPFDCWKNTKKLLDFLRFGTDKRSIFLPIFEFEKFDKKSPGDDFLKRYCEKISIILQKTTTMDSVL